MFMPSFFIKLLELGITTACLVLQQYSYDLTDVPTLILCSGTYVGFILVLTGEIIGEMIRGKQDPFIEAWWSGAGAALFGSCAARTLHAWRYVPDSPRRERARAAAICALAATSILILDAIRVICADDGSSIASSEHKLTKARAPKLGLDLAGNYNNSPICINNLSPLRLNPARLTTKEIPMDFPDIGLNSKPLFQGTPKLSPQKFQVSKLPMTCKPLRMAPKVMRSFW